MEAGAPSTEGEPHRVHPSEKQLRHIPQDGRGRQLFPEQEVGQVCRRSQVLLRLPNGSSWLPQPLCSVLLGCADGDRVFLTTWEQLVLPSSLHFCASCCACAC